MRLPVLALLFLSLARAGGSSLALPDAADITTPGDIAGLSKSDEVVFRKLENDFRSAGFSSVTFPNNTTVHLGIPSGPFSELRLQVSGNVDRKARYHSYTAIVREPRPWAEILGDTGENPHAVGFSADGHRVWRVGDVYVAADPNGDGILVPAWVSSNRNVVALTLDRLRSTMATAVEAGDVRGADAVLRVLLAFGYQEAAADVERFDALLWKRCPAGLDAVATRARRATTADEALRALRAAVDIALERCVVDGVLRKDAAKSLVALAGDLPSEARALRGLAAGDSFDAEGLERLRSELTGLTRPTMSDSDWAASTWDARVDALADAQVAFARGTDRERAELQPWLEARTTELAATLSAEADAARGRNEVVTGALLDAAVRRMRGEPVETVALGGSTAGSRLREALFAADGEFVARALEQSAVAVAGFRLDGLPTTPRATLAAGAVTGEIKGPTEASRTVPHTYAKLTTIENPALFEHEVRVRELRRQLDQTREAERSLRNAVVQTKFVAGQTTYSQELTTRVAETQKVYNTYDYQLVARTTPARWETTVNHDNAARADVLKAEATRREAELAAMKPPPARIESRVPTTVPLEEKVQRWSGQRARTLSIAVEGATTTREQVFDLGTLELRRRIAQPAIDVAPIDEFVDRQGVEALASARLDEDAEAHRVELVRLAIAARIDGWSTTQREKDVARWLLLGVPEGLAAPLARIGLLTKPGAPPVEVPTPLPFGVQTRSPDGARVALVTGIRTVQIHDASTGRKLIGPLSVEGAGQIRWDRAGRVFQWGSVTIDARTGKRLSADEALALDWVDGASRTMLDGTVALDRRGDEWFLRTGKVHEPVFTASALRAGLPEVAQPWAPDSRAAISENGSWAAIRAMSTGSGEAIALYDIRDDAKPALIKAWTGASARGGFVGDRLLVLTDRDAIAFDPKSGTTGRGRSIARASIRGPSTFFAVAEDRVVELNGLTVEVFGLEGDAPVRVVRRDLDYELFDVGVSSDGASLVGRKLSRQGVRIPIAAVPDEEALDPGDHRVLAGRVVGVSGKACTVDLGATDGIDADLRAWASKAAGDTPSTRSELVIGSKTTEITNCFLDQGQLVWFAGASIDFKR